MSQHSIILNNGHTVLYGADKPTGGFFISELDANEELVYSCDGMYFATFLETLEIKFQIYADKSLKNILRQEWFDAPSPTNLQRNVYKLFKKQELLDVVASVTQHIIYEEQ